MKHDPTKHGPNCGCDDKPSIPPKHYSRGTIQPWDYIIDQDMTYCIGSAVKYLSRYRDKGKAINDLEKAINFINREIKRLKDGG